MAQVTVVIPCYNQGNFVKEAVASVQTQTFQDIEIVIVNDGSTDDSTNKILQDYENTPVRILTTDNQGLASARNNGIRKAHGKYILPLDADDRIAPTYIEQAVRQLDTREELGIVYCEAELFGAVKTQWLLPEFSLKEMLLDNVIFCSAMFRKSDWERIGGYDPGMIYGWEDYDFWLSLIELGCEVYQIPEVLFFYRVASDSMVRSRERWQKVAMFKRIFKRHQKLFADNIEVWINSLLDVRERYYSSKLYVDTGQGLSDKECVSRKVDKGSSEVQFSLCEYKGIKAIRFDPVDSPVVIELIKIILTDRDGERRELTDYGSNCDFQYNKESFFISNDPHYFFHLKQKELDRLESVIVQLRFKALGTEALTRICMVQQDKLQESSVQLNRMSSSGVMAAVITAIVPCENENVFQYFKRQLKLF